MIFNILINVNKQNGGPGGSEITSKNQNTVKKCGGKWPFDFIEAFSMFPAPFPRRREYGQERIKKGLRKERE